MSKKTTVKKTWKTVEKGYRCKNVTKNQAAQIVARARGASPLDAKAIIRGELDSYSDNVDLGDKDGAWHYIDIKRDQWRECFDSRGGLDLTVVPKGKAPKGGKKWWAEPKYKYGAVAVGVLIAIVLLRKK